MKFFIGFIVIISLLFLFAGLFSVGLFSNTHSQNKKLVQLERIQVAESKLLGERYTINQIDSVTASYNYPFTSVGASNSSVYAVAKSKKVINQNK